MTNDEYEFTTDWFSQFEGMWGAIFQQLVPHSKKILEIGSYEARSTIWLIQNGFLPDKVGQLYCIDTWQGSVEFDNVSMGEVERRFDRNIEKARKLAPLVAISKIKTTSSVGLTKLLAEGHAATFDFIYVDGSHQASDVLGDLVLSFHLCRVGGLIACDDYLWNFGQNPLLTPKIAIDSFVNCFSREVIPVLGPPLHQIFLRKVTE